MPANLKKVTVILEPEGYGGFIEYQTSGGVKN
jgi:hypothetical protein